MGVPHSQVQHAGDLEPEFPEEKTQVLQNRRVLVFPAGVVGLAGRSGCTQMQEGGRTARCKAQIIIISKHPWVYMSMFGAREVPK